MLRELLGLKSTRTRILEALEKSLSVYETLVLENGYLLGRGLSEKRIMHRTERGYRQIEITLQKLRESENWSDANLRLFIPGNNDGEAYEVFEEHGILRFTSLMKKDTDEVLASLEKALELRGYYLPPTVKAFRLSVTGATYSASTVETSVPVEA